MLEAAGHYRFGAGDELRGVAVTIAWGTRDALLIPRQAARARRLLPWAQHVALQRLRPRALSTTTRRPSRRCCWPEAGEG